MTDLNEANNMSEREVRAFMQSRGLVGSVRTAAEEGLGGNDNIAQELSSFTKTIKAVNDHLQLDNKKPEDLSIEPIPNATIIDAIISDLSSKDREEIGNEVTTMPQWIKESNLDKDALERNLTIADNKLSSSVSEQLLRSTEKGK